MKQTQRAKDYPVIGELARLLPPEREIAWTTDPDRVLALAPLHGKGLDRRPVRVALAGGSREDLPEAHRRVCELAERRLPPDPSSRET